MAVKHVVVPGIAAIALVLVITACSGDNTTAVSPPPDADLAVVAENTSFSTPKITLTAGEETILYFVNRDSMDHNLSIYPDENSSDALFQGEQIANGSGRYRIPPLEAGTYYFRCDPHASMNGSVVVEEGAS